MIAMMLFILGMVSGQDAKDPTQRRWDRSCRMEFYGHYFAKNCVPRGDGLCPQYFTCPPVQRDANSCSYRGANYPIGSSVPVTHPCSPDCFCSESFPEGNVAVVECAIVDCPDVFHRPDPNCLPLFSHNRCCSVGGICFRDGVPTPPNPVTCKVNNQTYYEGQYVDFDDYPCQSCICQEGFSGPLGPGCQPVDCGFDFRYNVQFADGCVPIYFESGCCGFGFACPSDHNLTPETNPLTQNNQNNVCRFGGQSFMIGQKLKRKRCEEVCGCKTPPELTCIEYQDCQQARASNFFDVGY